jgi:ribosomal-protein-alanine N-acetyltransferase
MHIIFETHRLLVRQYTYDDGEDFYRLNSDPEVMKFIRTPKSRNEALEFLRENIAYYAEFPDYGRWALLQKKDGQFLGSFMLRPSATQKDKVELGYALFKPFWGIGFATEATIGGIAYGFGTLKLNEIIAITQLGNIPSKQVLLKSGFLPAEDFNEGARKVNLFTIQNPCHG